MQRLEFLAIREALKRAPLPEVDAVVGIATGGIVPAALAAYEIGKPLYVLGVNYRDEANNPRYAAPQITESVILPGDVHRVLLVDDVAVSGRSLIAARSLLTGIDVVTMVCKAKSKRADIILFPDIPGCVAWPWKHHPQQVIRAADRY
ncbi:MAG: hypothetical protein IT539_09220 [Bradyrhizobiaceae bacterium]|nr:hypothetical protein [Bradyrhizobiaceae bacterium]